MIRKPLGINGMYTYLFTLPPKSHVFNLVVTLESSAVNFLPCSWLNNHVSYAKRAHIEDSMSNLFGQMQASVKDADKNLRNIHLANEDGSHLSQTFFSTM